MLHFFRKSAHFLIESMLASRWNLKKRCAGPEWVKIVILTNSNLFFFGFFSFALYLQKKNCYNWIIVIFEMEMFTPYGTRNAHIFSAYLPSSICTNIEIFQAFNEQQQQSYCVAFFVVVVLLYKKRTGNAANHLFLQQFSFNVTIF